MHFVQGENSQGITIQLKSCSINLPSCFFLSRPMLCYPLLCNIILTHSWPIQCYATVCNAILCNAIQCNAILCYGMICHSMLHHNEQSYAVPHWANRTQSGLDVIYQTRERVFHQDIQTPRSGLKNRGAAEFFWPTSRCLDTWWNTLSSFWYGFSNHS